MVFHMQQNGRYTILKEIAAGGTATVFLAEDSVLKRKVALKKLHPHLLNRPEMVKRFEKEAVAVASLSHENVIRVFDYGREENGVFLAMEFIDGVSLEALLREAGGSLPCLAAMSLFRQLLDGLAAAHALGICHRDIKPSNVLVDKKGRVCIADFGIAFLSEETSITRTGSFLGTPGYASPEQALGKTVTVQSDIFATGILFYRALSGRLPFPGDTPHAILVSIMQKEPEDLGRVNRRLSPGLAGLVERMLAKEPAARPTAEQCADELQAMASELGVLLEAERVRRLVQDPIAYAVEENRELAGMYLARAREAKAKAKPREAMKLYGWAEVFGGGDEAIAKEATGYILGLRKGTQRRWTFMGIGVGIFAAVAGWSAYRLLPSSGIATTPVSARAADVRTDPAGIPPMPVAQVDVPAPPASAAPSASSQPPAPEPSSAGPVAPERHIAKERPPERPKAQVASITRIRKPAEEKIAPTERQAPAWLFLRTNPPFVSIRIDGNPRGATPLANPLSLASGTHLLELEKEGCLSMRKSIDLSPSETLFLRFTLPRKTDEP